MDFNEALESLKTFEGTDDYNNYANSLVTSERVKAFLDTDEGKALIAPHLDSHFSKSLETWKTNNLQKEVDRLFAEQHPDITPEQKRIAELEKKIAESEAKALHSNLINYATKIASEKNLPVSLIEHFIGSDEDSTKSNLESLESAFNAAVEKVVTDRLSASHKPAIRQKEKTLSLEELGNMTTAEVLAYRKSLKGKDK